jgi:hypothetical protein
MTFSLTEFNLKKKIYSIWAFHIDDHSESSSTYDMIIGYGRDLRRELSIIMTSRTRKSLGLLILFQ